MVKNGRTGQFERVYGMIAWIAYNEPQINDSYCVRCATPVEKWFLVEEGRGC